MKKFDPHWGNPPMPQEVKDLFFKCYKHQFLGNGCWVEFDVGFTDFSEKKHSSKDSEEVEDYQLVSKWLLENGCKNGESVMIKHWW